jgi:peptidoglycan/xylan/chitin deacetylase (PgdA/CDA1 family)
MTSTSSVTRSTRRRPLALVLVLGVVLASLAVVAGDPDEASAATRDAAVTVRGDTWRIRGAAAGGGDLVFRYGRAGDLPVMGDWNGDGVTTPGVVRGRTWYLRNSRSAGVADIVFRYGRIGDVPVVGDWNGDGVDTAGVVRGTTWMLRNSNTVGAADVTFPYGRTGDVPVVGDWNRNGVSTPGVVRGATWYLRNRLSGGAADVTFAYGRAGDVPVTGDWNGDGRTTTGVVRGATWYLRNTLSGGSANVSFAFGACGDVGLSTHGARTTPGVPVSLRGTEWTTLPTNAKVVALTFDAGANADGFPKILDTLQRTGTPGTFFLTGQWTTRYPTYARQAAAYPVGNHTVTHPDLTTVSDATVRKEIIDAHLTIRSVTGAEPRPWFRFPFGARDARTIGLANCLQYGSVRWTVDTLGWQGTSGGQSVSTVTSRVVSNLKPGAIVLMHVGSHPTDRSTLDADALATVIREIRARGYTLVDLDAYR